MCGAALAGHGVGAWSWLAGLATSGAIAAAEPAGLLRGRFRVQDASAVLFRPHLDTTFAVRSTGGSRVRLLLARVIEGPRSDQVEQFSLLFHGPAGGAIPDGTYAFQHPALGAFDLFIVAIGGANAPRNVYEACFTRHVSQPCQINS